jgi:hypothetical protein
MEQNQCVRVKSRSLPLAESLRDAAAFHDAWMDIIDEFGFREGLRFIGRLVRDGVIPAVYARRLKVEACMRLRAMVA